MEKGGHKPRSGDRPIDVEGNLKRLVELFMERSGSQDQSRPTVQPGRSSSARRKAFLGIDSNERQTAKELLELKKQIQDLTALSAAQRQVKPQKLPRKKVGMSQYRKFIDKAGITDLQREYFLLKFERGMSVADIARHKGVHHSTVQEHIRRALKKMERLNGAKLV
jgi:DNA-binding CsgD family transcriptional regulator